MIVLKTFKQRLFLKNFTLIISLPLIITLILGSFSIIVLEQYLKNEINKNNAVLLSQNKNNIEFILNEIDYLYLVFGINKDITLQMKRILNTSLFSLEDLWQLNMIKSILNGISYSKPYIQSIYVYFKNQNDNFLATPDGIAKISTYYDNEWFEDYLKSSNDNILWIEKRKIKLYNFEDNPINVITIYKKIKSSQSKNQSEGVIVLNIYLDYIENLLNAFSSIPEHTICIIDNKNNILCQNNQNNFITYEQLRLDKLNNKYIINKLSSEKFGLRFISIVPKYYLYKVPIKLAKLILTLLIFLFLFASIIAYYIARINYLNIKKIIDIIESAISGKPLPSLPQQYNDEYGYITYNIIKNFIEQDYLKIQLSEKKYKLRTLELLALQSQINPHFLFNTFETIHLKTLALTGKPNEVTKMIENLSHILKYSLSNPTNTISIKEEIDNTKSYIEILKIRYKEKFDVIWKYNNEILEYKIMKLLFQPLIENAVYHGIKHRDKKSGVKIKIKLDTASNNLKISIIDNGIGMSKEKLDQIKEQLSKDFDYSEHIGLLNTNERLKLIYADNYKMKILSKLGFGTVIKLVLPLE